MDHTFVECHIVYKRKPTFAVSRENRKRKGKRLQATPTVSHSKMSHKSNHNDFFQNFLVRFLVSKEITSFPFLNF